MKTCKWCDKGNQPKDGMHTFVTSIIPAELTMIACTEPRKGAPQSAKFYSSAEILAL